MAERLIKKSQRAFMQRRWHPCPSCNAVGWHLSWCPYRSEPRALCMPGGNGTGRPLALSGIEAEKEARVLADLKTGAGTHLEPSV